MSNSGHYSPHAGGKGQSNFRRGGSEYGYCHIHRKKRTRSDLIPSTEILGKWRCLPHKECRTELVTCRRHGRTRNPAQMKQVAPGVWECTPGMECRGAGIAAPHSSVAAGASGIKGGTPSGMRGHSDGEGPFRVAHPHSRYHGGSPFGWAPSLPQSGSNSTHPTNLQRSMPFQSASAAAAGGPTARAGERSAEAWESVKVSSLNPTSNERMSASGGGGVGEDGSSYPFLGLGVRRDRQGQPTSSSNDKVFNRREHLSEKRLDHRQGSLFCIHRAGRPAAGGGVSSFASHPVGWCVLHGKRIRMADCRAEEEHFAVCADPSACLSTPLDPPRELGSRGCDEVLCSLHRTLRSVAFVELTADRQGYQCFPAHKCLYITSSLSLRRKQEEPYTAEESFLDNGIKAPTMSSISSSDALPLLPSSSSIASTARRNENEGIEREDDTNWFMNASNEDGADMGEETAQAATGPLGSGDDDRLLFFSLTDEVGGEPSSSSMEDAAFFYS